MGCLYNGVCSSLIALFLWQQVTNLAAVMAHCGISLTLSLTPPSVSLYLTHFLTLPHISLSLIEGGLGTRLWAAEGGSGDSGSERCLPEGP